VFEDLIKTPKSRDKISLCPFCSSKYISRYVVTDSGYQTKTQRAYCNKCYKHWYIVYDKYMTKAEIKYKLDGEN